MKLSIPNEILDYINNKETTDIIPFLVDNIEKELHNLSNVYPDYIRIELNKPDTFTITQTVCQKVLDMYTSQGWTNVQCKYTYQFDGSNRIIFYFFTKKFEKKKHWYNFFKK